MHKLELEISLDKGQKQHARISSPGKFPSVPSPFSFSSICKGMGRNWSKQLKSCCNLGFCENRSEVDIQGWYSVSPMMCDIPRGKQRTLELAKEDPEHDRVGSWEGALFSWWKYTRFPVLLSDTVFQNWQENLSCFAWILQRKKKRKQLILSLIFCKIYHINFHRLYTILSVTSMLILVLALASLSPASLLSFPRQPTPQRRCRGRGAGAPCGLNFTSSELWKSWRSNSRRGRKWGHQTGSTAIFKKLHRINKALACF